MKFLNEIDIFGKNLMGTVPSPTPHPTRFSQSTSAGPVLYNSHSVVEFVRSNKNQIFSDFFHFLLRVVKTERV